MVLVLIQSPVGNGKPNQSTDQDNHEGNHVLDDLNQESDEHSGLFEESQVGNHATPWQKVYCWEQLGQGLGLRGNISFQNITHGVSYEQARYGQIEDIPEVSEYLHDLASWHQELVNLEQGEVNAKDEQHDVGGVLGCFPVGVSEQGGNIQQIDEGKGVGLVLDLIPLVVQNVLDGLGLEDVKAGGVLL